MDFQYTPEQEAYRAKVRSWLEANQPGKIEQVDSESLGDDRLWNRLKDWHTRLYQGGWMGLTWPKEYGGQRRDLYRAGDIPAGAWAAESADRSQRARHYHDRPGPDAMGHRRAEVALSRTDSLGKEIWCEGMSEPGAGSDLAAMQMRAVLEGDSFVVNGQKVWTTIAHRSDFVQLFVRTDPELPKHKGMSCLLVDMKAPGVTVKPLKQISGDSEFNEIFFEDVRVPKENLLGPLNMGWQVLVATLMHERFGIGETLGGSEQMLTQLVELAKTVQR